MKAAICLSGQLRNFKDCYESLLENIIRPTNADVYVYAWNFSPSSFQKDNVTQRFAENGTEEEFLDLYKPVIHKFECCDKWLESINKYVLSPKNHYAKNKAPETNIERMMCMLYTSSSCFRIVDKKVDYDIVFRCRTEITYERKISTEDLTGGNLVIPHGTDGRGGYQDSFAFGPPDLMNIYTSLYHYVPIYANQGEMVHPEHLLKYHLTRQKAPVQRIDFPMKLRGRRYS